MSRLVPYNNSTRYGAELKEACKPTFIEGAAPVRGNKPRLQTSSRISAGSNQLGTLILELWSQRDKAIVARKAWKLGNCSRPAKREVCEDATYPDARLWIIDHNHTWAKY